MTRDDVNIREENWVRFVAWAQEHGISIEDEGDWGPWYDAWYDGYNAGAEDNE